QRIFRLLVRFVQLDHENARVPVIIFTFLRLAHFRPAHQVGTPGGLAGDLWCAWLAPGRHVIAAAAGGYPQPPGRRGPEQGGVAARPATAWRTPAARGCAAAQRRPHRERCATVAAAEPPAAAEPARRCAVQGGAAARTAAAGRYPVPSREAGAADRSRPPRLP